jgi:predicted NUDIX family NTP pyrophosphohydrolase
VPKQSAGILMYRFRNGELQVLLVHPGGPYWARKDAGAWSVPKGEYPEGEDPLSAAQREFAEETGFTLAPPFLPLAPVRQAGGKEVVAWAVEGECDPESLRSNTFSMEWPPRSGRSAEFPEVDRAEWFSIAEAQNKILPGQRPLLVQLTDHLGRS